VFGEAAAPSDCVKHESTGARCLAAPAARLVLGLTVWTRLGVPLWRSCWSLWDDQVRSQRGVLAVAIVFPCIRSVLVCAIVCGWGRYGEGLYGRSPHGGTVRYHGRQCRCTLHAIWTCTDSLRFAVPMAVYSLLPMFCAFFGACPWSVTFSDPTSERPLPDKVGVWVGGGAVGLHATREHRCTQSGGVRGAPLWALCLARGEAGSSPHGFVACLLLSLSLCFLSLCVFLRAWDALVSVFGHLLFDSARVRVFFCCLERCFSGSHHVPFLFSCLFSFLFCVIAAVRRLWLRKPWHMFWFLLHNSNRTLPCGLVAGRLDGGGNRYDGETCTCTAGGAHRHVGYFERAGMDGGVGSARNSGAGGF